MFVRTKKIKGYTYYYLVESNVEDGKIRQKVVKYLGTAENILSVFNSVETGKAHSGTKAKVRKHV